VSARRTLVTGGAGFIGSHLVDHLVREGAAVRVLDDFSSGREPNLEHSRDAIELLRGDVGDAALLSRGLDGVDVVFHLAAVPSVPETVADPVRTHRTNLTATLELLEASRRAGVRRVVFAASCAVYGDSEELPKRESMAPEPLSPYALHKHAGETYCRLYHELYGLETVALRLFNVFGPRQDPASDYAAVIPRFVTACLADEPARIFGDGGQTRDFTYVADAVRAHLLAADAPRAAGARLNVAGGRAISLNELLSEIADLTGSTAPPVHESARPADVRHSGADLARARELLGYAPSVPLRDGLRRTIEYFRELAEKGDA